MLKGGQVVFDSRTRGGSYISHYSSETRQLKYIYFFPVGVGGRTEEKIVIVQFRTYDRAIDGKHARRMGPHHILDIILRKLDQRVEKVESDVM